MEANLNKEKNAAIGIEELSSILNTLTKEISALKDLPEQVQWLTERVTNLPAVSKETQSNNSPTGPDPFVTTDILFDSRSTISTVSPIRFKDVIFSISRYDGHKMSVLQFSKICERALKFIPPQQEP